MKTARSAILSFFIATILSAPHDGFAQTAESKEPHKVSCTSEGNTLAFEFNDRNSATLTRIEGTEINAFSDLQERDWTVRFVLEQGAPYFHIENAKGAKLALMLPPKTVETLGTLTWNNPPGAKVDLLCDLGAPLPWEW